MVGQKPIARFSAAGVSVALWENEIRTSSGAKKMLKASLSRRYKDSNGEWKSSGSFSRNEIPLAIHCLQKAFERILDEEHSQEPETGGVEEEVVM